MASLQATRLKKGMLIKMGEDLFRVLELQHVTPGNLRGFVRVKMRNIRNGALADNRFRSEDTVERATLDEREMQYLYHDGDDYYFMDTTSFEQIHISSEALGDSVNYLKPEMTIHVEFYGIEPVGIELPQTVDLKVVDTAPGIKGATASNQIKPATLETGLVVNVPPFVNSGDMVRVSTDTGEYLSARLTARSKNRRTRDAEFSTVRDVRDLRELEAFYGRRPAAHPGLDRSHRRQHVQRQERGAHPPAAPRPDRQAARRRSSSRSSTPGSPTTTSSRTARCASSRAR